MKLPMRINLALVMMCSAVPSMVARLGVEKGSHVKDVVVKPNPRLLSNCVNVINGTDGDDLLIGTDCNDIIYGLGGDDTIRGANGDDTLIGGTGNDWLVGGEGKDSMEGGAGDDEVDAGEGDDIVIGEEGNDTLRGEDGSDVLVGGVGDDFISGGRDQDTISGGDGMDDLLGGEGDDIIDGGEKSDTINAGAGSDALLGGAGDDVLIGGDGSDHITGGAGTNTIKGATDGDVIHAHPNSDGVDSVGGENWSDVSTPYNDDCSNAIPLVLEDGEISVSGSTSNATNGDKKRFCHYDPRGPWYYAVDSPGIWYKVKGNGKRFTASTCNAATYRTQLFIYTGSCDAPLCVEGNDNTPGCQATGISYDVTSVVSWISVEGVAYYIFVTGASWGYENENNSGDFTLTVSVSDADPAPKPANDRCENAVALSFDNNTVSVAGTTVGASHDGVPVCRLEWVAGMGTPLYNVHSPTVGVWYSIEGDGDQFFADVWPLELELYTGCPSLECAYGPGNLFTSRCDLAWNTNVGETYYIRVKGGESDFNLTVSKEGC